MSAFDPTQHPRGNKSTGHAGQFATKQQTGAEVRLGTSPLEQPLNMTVQLERWSSFDSDQVEIVDEIEVDVRPIFDTMTLDDLPEDDDDLDPSTSDWIVERARGLGLFDYDGPYTVYPEDSCEQIDQYLEARRDAGYEDEVPGAGVRAAAAHARSLQTRLDEARREYEDLQLELATANRDLIAKVLGPESGIPDNTTIRCYSDGYSEVLRSDHAFDLNETVTGTQTLQQIPLLSSEHMASLSRIDPATFQPHDDEILDIDVSALRAARG